MSPAASRRFRVRLCKALGYVADIPATDEATAEAIADYLMDHELWDRIFALELENFTIIETAKIDAEERS